MHKHHHHPRNNAWLGVLIILIGSIILLKRADIFDFPNWLFSWKTLLIGIGLAIGARSGFRNIGWLFPFFIGCFFLLNDLVDLPYDIHRYIWPSALIVLGIFLVYRSSVRARQHAMDKEFHRSGWQSSESSEDVVDIQTTFSGAERKVFSKQFKGGRVSCVFGGVEIDLRRADVSGTAVIDLSVTFGGVKLLVPSDWEVESNLSATMGGFEDKRSFTGGYASNKKLILNGSAVMGGVEIRN